MEQDLIEKIRGGIRRTLTSSKPAYFSENGPDGSYKDETIRHLLTVLETDEYTLIERIKVLTIYKSKYESRAFITPRDLPTNIVKIIDAEIAKYQNLLLLETNGNLSTSNVDQNTDVMKNGKISGRTQNSVLLALKYLFKYAEITHAGNDITEVAKFLAFITGYDEENFRKWYNEPIRKSGKPQIKELQLVSEKLNLIGIKISTDQLQDALK